MQPNNDQEDMENFEKMVRTVITKVDELDNAFRQIKASIESLEEKIAKEEEKMDIKADDAEK